MPQKSGPAALQPPTSILEINFPWTLTAGGGPWGVSVVIRYLDEDPRGDALVQALDECVVGPPTRTTFGRIHDIPTGRFRIIVGPKLP